MAGARYIKILVEVTEFDQAQIITSGTYQWQFPVMVPLLQPFAAEWYVSLCSQPSCDSEQTCFRPLEPFLDPEKQAKAIAHRLYRAMVRVGSELLS